MRQPRNPKPIDQGKTPATASAPAIRPSAANGVPSIRGYRRLGDFMLEQALAGRISCREAAAFIGACHKQAELLAGEKAMRWSEGQDIEPQDHQLGHHGGIHLVEDERDIASMTPGYETLAPSPDDVVTTAELALRTTAADVNEKLVAPPQAKNYPTSKAKSPDSPVPETTIDVTSMDGVTDEIPADHGEGDGFEVYGD